MREKYDLKAFMELGLHIVIAQYANTLNEKQNVTILRRKP